MGCTRAVRRCWRLFDPGPANDAPAAAEGVAVDGGDGALDGGGAVFRVDGAGGQTDDEGVVTKGDSIGQFDE